MNIAAQCRAIGPLFSVGAPLVANAKMAEAVHAATDVLAHAIQAAAPAGRNKLRGSIKAFGVGTGRGVRVGEWYAIPLESGQKPGKGLNKAGIAKVAEWAQYQLGLGPKEARRFAYAWSRWKLRHSVPRKRFFFGTYDRLAPYLQTHYLGRVGLNIVAELS